MDNLENLKRERTMSWTLITEKKPPSDTWVLFTLKRNGKYIVMAGKYFGLEAAYSDTDYTFCCGINGSCVCCCHGGEGIYSMGIDADEVMAWMQFPTAFEYDIYGNEELMSHCASCTQNCVHRHVHFNECHTEHRNDGGINA